MEGYVPDYFLTNLVPNKRGDTKFSSGGMKRMKRTKRDKKCS